MSKDLNTVHLIGRVGRDPEIRYAASGRAVVNFSLATGEEWKDQEGNKQEKTQWHRIVIWGKLAEICGQYVKKGTKVYLGGKIDYREWEDQDGNKRQSTDIVCSDMIMLSYADQGGDGGAQRERPKSQPQQNRPSSGASQTRQTSRTPPPDDDIPF